MLDGYMFNISINFAHRSHVILFICVVCFDSLPASQQIFCHVETGRPALNQYQAEDKASSSKRQI